jgi:hypothetical protein
MSADWRLKLRWHIPPKLRIPFTRLHGVITQETIMRTITAFKISKFTCETVEWYKLKLNSSDRFKIKTPILNLIGISDVVSEMKLPTPIVVYYLNYFKGLIITGRENTLHYFPIFPNQLVLYTLIFTRRSFENIKFLIFLPSFTKLNQVSKLRVEPDTHKNINPCSCKMMYWS